MRHQDLATIDRGSIVNVKRGQYGKPLPAKFLGVERRRIGKYSRKEQWLANVELIDPEGAQAYDLPHTYGLAPGGERLEWTELVVGPIWISCRYVRDLEADAERAKELAAQARADRLAEQERKRNVTDNTLRSMQILQRANPDKSVPVVGLPHVGRDELVVSFPSVSADVTDHLVGVLGKEWRMAVVVWLDEEGNL